MYASTCANKYLPCVTEKGTCIRSVTNRSTRVVEISARGQCELRLKVCIFPYTLQSAAGLPAFVILSAAGVPKMRDSEGDYSTFRQILYACLGSWLSIDSRIDEK